MPTVLREAGYQFIIFTSDHPPPHVHVRREGKLAKVLLSPIEFLRTGGLNSGEQSEILQITRNHHDFLLAEWDKLHPSEGDNDGE
jgi:Domain of unknown function (DUF4160)